jgi:hypothetical protein
VNRNNNSISDSEGGPIRSRDPLADRLRSEAMAERPAFSRELHLRVLERVRETKLATEMPRGIGKGRWLAIAAAVLIVAAAGLTAFQITHLQHLPGQTRSLPLGDQTPRSSALQPVLSNEVPSTFLAVGNAGVFSARLWPPEITLSLPIARSSAPPISEHSPATAEAVISLPGSPDWLLDKLQEQTSSVQSTLVELIPPQARALLRHANN